MPKTTPNYGLPFPEDGDPTDVAGDFERLATRLDSGLWIDADDPDQLAAAPTTGKPLSFHGTGRPDGLRDGVHDPREELQAPDGSEYICQDPYGGNNQGAHRWVKYQAANNKLNWVCTDGTQWVDAQASGYVTNVNRMHVRRTPHFINWYIYTSNTQTVGVGPELLAPAYQGPSNIGKLNHLGWPITEIGSYGISHPMYPVTGGSSEHSVGAWNFHWRTWDFGNNHPDAGASWRLVQTSSSGGDWATLAGFPVTSWTFPVDPHLVPWPNDTTVRRMTNDHIESLVADAEQTMPDGYHESYVEYLRSMQEGPPTVLREGEGYGTP